MSVLSSPLLRFVLGIFPSSAKRMPEMSDFQRTPARTRATYIAVAHTHKRHLARAHTTYLAVTCTSTRPRFVCEPSWIIFFSYAQVSFFLWGFFEAKNRSAMMVFGGQRTTKKSLSCMELIHFSHRRGSFLSLTKGNTCISR